MKPAETSPALTVHISSPGNFLFPGGDRERHRSTHHPAPQTRRAVRRAMFQITARTRDSRKNTEYAENAGIRSVDRIRHQPTRCNLRCEFRVSCIDDVRDMCRKKSRKLGFHNSPFPLGISIAVLEDNSTVNIVVDCCRISYAKKGKLGTILAHSWHIFGTNDFDILQSFDSKYVCLWCREGGSNPHDRKGRRILSPLRLPVPPSRLGDIPILFHPPAADGSREFEDALPHRAGAGIAPTSLPDPDTKCVPKAKGETLASLASAFRS